MPARIEKFAVESRGDDIIDITNKVREVVKSCGVKSGVAIIYTPDPLCAVTTMEFEPNLIEDVKKLVREYLPGTEAHKFLKAAVIGSSISVPIVDGDLPTGSFQQIVLIDLNERGGHREVVVCVLD